MYGYIGAIAIAGAALAYTHHWAYERGIESEKVNQQEDAEILRKVKEEARQGAADAISKIQIVNRTIRQTFQKEIIKEPVYTDCKHTPTGLQQVNNALEGRIRETGPDGTDKLPEDSGQAK